MKIHDLLITIENPRGSYKKFREGYAVEGVTFPTHYGYINGYVSEDGKDLDVFLGSGELHGFVTMKRPTFPNGVETKTFVQVSKDELTAIKKAYEPVIVEVAPMIEEVFMKSIQNFIDNRKKDFIFANVLSTDHAALIKFYTEVVGLEPVDKSADPSQEKWYGFNTGHAQFAIEPMSNRDKYNFEYAKGNPVLIQFRAKDIQDLTEWTERLEKEGVIIGQRIMEKSYGIVTTFVDPDGNVVELLLERG